MAGDGPFRYNLALNAPTPNSNDARFTFHTRRAVQSAIADFLVNMAVRGIPKQLNVSDFVSKRKQYITGGEWRQQLAAYITSVEASRTNAQERQTSD